MKLWKFLGVELYEVGDLYLTMNNKNPGLRFKGTWQLIAQGRTLVGVDTSQTEFNSVEKTGGAKNHTLTIDEIPKHSHGQYTSDRGGKQPFTLANGGGTNMPGYWYSSPNSYTGPQVLTSEVGNGNPHNNLPPYLTTYIWERVS